MTNTKEAQYSGPINPGSPVMCQSCGAEYVPMTYECKPQDCPQCGK